jgi:hypothetical protein
MKRISKKKADALIKQGGRVEGSATARVAKPPLKKKAPAGARANSSIREENRSEESPKLFNKEDIKSIMVEAIKIATASEKHQIRRSSRLVVHRDDRGFIDTVDIVPVEDSVTLN